MYSKRRKWKFRIRHILEAISRVQAYAMGLSFEAFKSDEKTTDAVVMKLTVIGEGQRAISPSRCSRHIRKSPGGRCKDCAMSSSRV